MTLSSLSTSPALSFLSGEPMEEIRKQSTLYRVDKKTLTSICNSLEEFYPSLIDSLRSQKHSVCPPEQWMVLSKTILHVFLCFLIDTHIVNNARKRGKVTPDVTWDSTCYYPQTQEELMHALGLDSQLRQQFLLASLYLSMSKKVQLPRSIPLLHIASLKNLKSYAIKKVLQFQEKTAVGKSDIAVVAAGSVGGLLQFLTKKYTFTVLDSQLINLHTFPRLPNWNVREEVERELDNIFFNLNLPQHFADFTNRRQSASALAQLVTRLLPVQDVEGFRAKAQRIDQLIEKANIKLIFTTAGHHDDLTNLFLGRARMKHIPLVTLQHGAGYAEYQSMQTERTIETYLYPTTYLSWGKGMKTIGDSHLSKVKPIGSPYLNTLPHFGFKVKKIQHILIPLEPIYYYQTLDGFIPSQPGFIAENYKALFAFLERMNRKHPNLTYICKVKPGHERQFAIRQYLSSDVGKRVVFTSKGKTYDYFNTETLVYLPTLSGAFHEAVMAQVPFLLYMPRNQDFLKRNIRPFFETLEKNSLAASTVSGLVVAADAQIQRKVSYKALRKAFGQWHDFASIKNPRWKRDVEKIIRSEADI